MVDSHAIVRNNTERSCVSYSDSSKVMLLVSTGILVAIQSRYRTFSPL